MKIQAIAIFYQEDRFFILFDGDGSDPFSLKFFLNHLIRLIVLSFVKVKAIFTNWTGISQVRSAAGPPLMIKKFIKIVFPFFISYKYYH